MHIHPTTDDCTAAAAVRRKRNNAALWTVFIFYCIFHTSSAGAQVRQGCTAKELLLVSLDIISAQPTTHIHTHICMSTQNRHNALMLACIICKVLSRNDVMDDEDE